MIIKEKENRKIIQSVNSSVNSNNRKVMLMGASDRALIKGPPMIPTSNYSEKKQSLVTPQNYSNPIAVNSGLKANNNTLQSTIGQTLKNPNLLVQ